MPDHLELPLPYGHLYRDKNDGKEVVLIYSDDVWMYDSRPDATSMLEAVLYMDEDRSMITYPKHLWEEEFEVVPVSITLFDEE